VIDLFRRMSEHCGDADGFNGFTVHLANHDVILWAVSRAPFAKLQAFKQRMGWISPVNRYFYSFILNMLQEQGRKWFTDVATRSQQDFQGQIPMAVSRELPKHQEVKQ
jgi:predicted dithiol-disulfide oxidoreductase (DUF899 family)